MADKKPKNFQSTTPKGTFRYPALDKPDYGTDEHPKPNGEFKTQMLFTEAEAESLIKSLKPIHEQAIKDGEAEFAKLKVDQRKKLKELSVNDLYSIEYDKETEEPTGNLIFKFSMQASGLNKKKERWERKPAVFDAKGKPMLKVPAVWGGTVGRVSYEAVPYFIAGTGTAGVKLRLNAAQIIDLVSGGQRDAGAYGFGEEDGYEAGEDQPEDDTPFKDESGDNSQEF